MVLAWRFTSRHASAPDRKQAAPRHGHYDRAGVYLAGQFGIRIEDMVL